MLQGKGLGLGTAARGIARFSFAVIPKPPLSHAKTYKAIVLNLDRAVDGLQGLGVLTLNPKSCGFLRLFRVLEP